MIKGKLSFLKIIALMLVITSTASVLFMSTNELRVHAAAVAGFTPGRIIDDTVFTSSNSMNVAQIQNFLNNKVPNCDTQGTTSAGDFGRPDLTHAQYAASKGWPSPPYTCLRNYSENNIGAAQIIFNVSQKYQINPQVLIVLLQKEQGLVTDTWPLPSQYRTATGYGCPDTAPCDSQYYGLTNQLDWSGKMFRAIMNNSSTWYTPYVLGDNFIRWNPNSSCGGSTVTIQNRATQALYNYTPYQPNQAALNAGYGNGDSCSSYGNRNFYLYFNDWFGNSRYVFGKSPSYLSPYAKQPCQNPTFNDGDIARLYNPDSRDFLYTTNPAEVCTAVSYGYIWDDIVMKNATGPDAIPVYRLSNAERHIFTSSSSVRTSYLNSFGYKDEGVGFYVYANDGPNRTPVQGLQRDETFFITSAGREAVSYESDLGFYNFGTMYYTQKMNTEPTSVYRLTRNNSRLYTTSGIEKSRAIAQYGFSDEGTISMNPLGPSDANMPVYRLRGPYGGYVYTTSRIERDSAIVNYGYYSEGIAFYSLLYSQAPVYRATSYQNLMRIYTSNRAEYDTAASRYGYSLEGVGWYSY